MLTTSESEARDWKMDPWISTTSFAPPNLLLSLSLFPFFSRFRWRCVLGSITSLSLVAVTFEIASFRKHVAFRLHRAL